MRVKYLKHNKIDYIKWDKCIENSSNSLIYAKAWYLDIVSPNWEALVADDYVYVMPLPVKRKYGIPYLVQPILTQQLGIFSSYNIHEKIVKKFIRKIPYLSYHLHLNEKNKIKNARALPNYVLNLNDSFDKLYFNFSKNTKRNIEKAGKLGVWIKENLPPGEYLDFYYSTEKKYSEPDRTVITELINQGVKRKEIMLYGAFDSDKELIAALCVLCSGNRLIYLLPVSNEQGKNKSAMFLIIYYIIRCNSQTDYFLDFEGSGIKGIARLYKGFGSKNKPYFLVKRLSINTFIEKLSFLIKE